MSRIARIGLSSLAVSAALLVASAPAMAGPFVTSIKVTSATPTYLQVAELQAFSGMTNVALGKTATAASTYAAFASPDKAFDGNTGGNYYSDTIYHSAGTGAGEYLSVDLGSAYNLSSLTIYGRTDCCSDRDTYSYFLFNGTTQVGSGSLNATAGPATVTFAGTPGAVPEAATWAMMLLGFGMVGFGLRRRAQPSVRVTYG